ncbi:MAG: hypothetical protein K5929_05180 [Lachnospiraceae bacterium]|nr:hypothetical protein [Lachnospiraceae bacterium]
MGKTRRICFWCCLIIAFVMIPALTVKADEKSELKKQKVYVASDAGVGTVSLGWSGAQGASKYRILASGTQKGGYKCVKKVKGTKTAVTLKVSAEKGQFYKVRPVYTLSDGTKLNGKKSEAVYVRSFDNPPAITVDVVTKGYRISWNPVKTYDGYEITAAYDDTEDYNVLKLIKKPGKKQFVDKYVEPGTKVSYRLRGFYVFEGKKIKGPLSEAVAVEEDGSVAEDPVDTLIPGDTVSGNTVSGNTVSGNAVSGNAVSGNSVSGNAVSGNTVSDNNITSTNITFNTRTFLTGIGGKNTVKAASAVSDAKPVYSVLNETVATVDQDGVLTGVGAGSTKVVAEIDGEKATAVVTVTDCAINGIDISKWQGDDVDFEKVREGGVSFVMMRIAYHLTKDTRFEQYYEGATAAGLKRGVYCYSMAKSVPQARKEAENLLEILDGRELDYPIAMDLEDESQLKGLSNADRTDMILAFKNRIEAAGYSFVLYVNLNWLTHHVESDRLSDVNLWIARYRTQSYGHGYTGKGNVVMWQYASNGLVDGILDVKKKYISIDMNVCYTTDFPVTYDPAYDPPAEDTGDVTDPGSTVDEGGSDTVSGNTVSGNTVSGNTVSGNTVSGDLVSGDPGSSENTEDTPVNSDQTSAGTGDAYDRENAGTGDVQDTGADA